MNTTLPLFADLEAATGTDAGATDAALRGTSSVADERHLRAAVRLSRAMGRYRDRSPEQTRAGLAICRHLRALLEDAAGSDPVGRDA